VNPSTPIGPGDLKPTPTGRMVMDAALGRMPAYVDTGLNIVHVDDVAAGHLRALERGRIGERYILGGEDMTLREILVRISGLVGRKPPSVRLPHAVLLPLALAAEGLARLTGGEARATVEGVRMARKHMYYSSDKAVRELGYSWRAPAAAFEDAIAWFREQGFLGPA
jgi:dihydroflavonol-4-reductase